MKTPCPTPPPNCPLESDVASAHQPRQRNADTYLLIGGPADGVRLTMKAGDVMRVNAHTGRAADGIGSTQAEMRADDEHRYLRTGISFQGTPERIFYRHEQLTPAEAMDFMMDNYPVGRMP